MSQYPVHIYNDVDALSRATAQRCVELADQAIKARGQFHIALSGGTTPRSLYERLTAPEFAGRVDWRHVHVWFGDERTVPADHPDSNYRMACEALLNHVPIPPAQVHRIEAEKDGAAPAYETQIIGAIPKSVAGVAQFDLILLGLGPDGHVASLFPGTAILQERTRQVAAVHVDKLNTWRISLTLPVIDNARHIMIFVAGAGKAEIMRQILTEGPRTVPYPVQMIRPVGTFEWYLDAAAAQALPQEVQP